MNKTIDLYEHNITELTEEQLINLCQLNNFKPKELKKLDLDVNLLFNINFITSNTHFKNLEILFIGWNNITDINNIKYLKKLEFLGINFLKLDNEEKTIELFKTMKNLKHLYCHEVFKEINILKLKEELPDLIISD